MNSPAIHIDNLEFGYRPHEPVIRGIQLQVEQGERFGLFGANGAGKTTLMNLMTGLIPYKNGSIQLLGNEIKDHPHKVNKLFGLVPQDFSFYHELSPAENMAFFGAWAGLKSDQIKAKTKELLTVMALDHVKDQPVSQFSGGMKRRVNLAIAVMHQPSILFLDEPTVGVDVQTRHAIIDYLKMLNKNGTTLVYTSHQLHEAEDLCNKVAMIDEGKIIVHDTLANLMKAHGKDGLEGLFLELTGRAYRF